MVVSPSASPDHCVITGGLASGNCTVNSLPFPSPSLAAQTWPPSDPSPPSPPAPWAAPSDPGPPVTSGSDVIAARSSIMLLRVYGYQLARAREGLAWADVADDYWTTFLATAA